MLATYDDYETELGFTESDIDNMFKKYVDLSRLSNCNERSWILLWNKKYINNEQFAKLMDLEYEDKKFWIVDDNFDSLLPSDYSYEASILDGTAEWGYGYFYEADVEQYWSDYNKDTLEEIIKFCTKKGIEYEEELLTEENTKLVESNGKFDIYFNDTKLVDLIYEDDFEELKTCLNHSICEAQESADRDEVYTKIKSKFEDKIGEYKWKSFKFTDYKGKEETKERLHVDVSNVDWNQIESDLKNEYGEYNFSDATYGNLKHILNEQDYFDFDKPNYDYTYGDIDDAVLNEYTQNRLDWD